MNTSQKLRSLLLASVLTGGLAHGGEPQPAPDVPALLALLNKLAAESAAADAEPAAESAAAPAPPAAAPTPAPAAKAPPTPSPTALRTSGLSTSGLTASGALGGRGPAPAVRLNDSDWRALFTARSTTK